MTDSTLINIFLSTPGLILQHADTFAYLKNELGECVIFATNHKGQKCVLSMTFEKAKDMMRLGKYILPYNCNVDDPIKAIAESIKEGEDSNCDYVAEPGLMEYLTT